MTDETQALVDRQIELLGQCEAFIAERFDADDGDAVALSNSIHAIRKTLEAAAARKCEQDEISLPDRSPLRAALTTLARDLEMARQERDAALAEDTRKLLLMTVERHKHTAAVRAARAETWAEAAKLVAQSNGDMTALLNRCDERATVARDG